MNLCVEKPIGKGKQEFAKDNAKTKKKQKERKKKSTVKLDICIFIDFKLMKTHYWKSIILSIYI